jgi:DnaJ-class molecular chaperone
MKESWEKTPEMEEEKMLIDCPECDGTGKIDGKTCWKCGGRGQIKEQ